MSNTYKCAACGETYVEGWTKEEAVAEYEKEFGHLPPEITEKPEVVCDDCYKRMMGK